MVHPLDETEYLVGRAREGDRQSYRRLIKRYMPFVYALCWARTTNAEAARRMAEAAFSIAYRNLWAAPGKQFRRWLYTTFRENVFSNLPSSSDIAEDHPLHLLASMPWRSREFITVHCASGLSMSEIAKTFCEDSEPISRAVAALAGAPGGGRLPCPMINVLPALLDDSLPLKKKAGVDAHIVECDECRKALASIRAALAGFKAAFKELLPGQDAAERIVSALPDIAPAPPERPRAVKALAAGWILATIAVALGLILYLLTRR